MNLVNTYLGSGNYERAVAAAILSLGGAHAPIAETIQFLTCQDPERVVMAGVPAGGMVPGFGNSFEKGHPDPIWEPVRKILEDSFTLLHGRLMDIQNALHGLGKVVYPNASAFTACAAIVTGIPAHLASYLVLKGRLDAWTDILAHQPKGSN